MALLDVFLSQNDAVEGTFRRFPAERPTGNWLKSRLPFLGFTVGLLLPTPRCLLIGLRRWPGLLVGASPCQRFGPYGYST
jgi:hypothetical protein